MVPAQSYEIPTLTTSLIVVSGRGVLKGWSLRETTGAAVAAVNIWDGTNNAGLILAAITLPSGGSEPVWLGELGLSFTRGLFVEVVAGSVRGALWGIPQEILTVDGADFAYATAPSTGGYPSMGIQEIE